MKIDKEFLESCSKTLKIIDSRNLKPILLGHDKEIGYLKAMGLISGDGTNYVVETLGRNWLDTFQFENLIADLENNKRLLDATETSAKAAETSANASIDSAKSARKANEIAAKSNLKASIANWIAFASALFTLLTLIYYILEHFKLI